MNAEESQIDQLLERYLGLLDEYTSLRTALNGIQTNMYQSIARANFSAERGMWYGRDYYDDRMQASRTLVIAKDPGDGPTFLVNHSLGPGEQHEGGENTGTDAETPKPRMPQDPIRWFGLLAPTPLRQAQEQAVIAVEEVVPRLASVNSEMLNIEVEVRRARKRRLKANMAQKKQDGRSNISDAAAEAT